MISATVSLSTIEACACLLGHIILHYWMLVTLFGVRMDVGMIRILNLVPTRMFNVKSPDVRSAAAEMPDIITPFLGSLVYNARMH